MPTSFTSRSISFCKVSPVCDFSSFRANIVVNCSSVSLADLKYDSRSFPEFGCCAGAKMTAFWTSSSFSCASTMLVRTSTNDCCHAFPRRRTTLPSWRSCTLPSAYPVIDRRRASTYPSASDDSLRRHSQSSGLVISLKMETCWINPAQECTSSKDWSDKRCNSASFSAYQA